MFERDKAVLRRVARLTDHLHERWEALAVEAAAPLREGLYSREENDALRRTLSAFASGPTARPLNDESFRQRCSRAVRFAVQAYGWSEIDRTGLSKDEVANLARTLKGWSAGARAAVALNRRRAGSLRER